MEQAITIAVRALNEASPVLQQVAADSAHMGTAVQSAGQQASAGMNQTGAAAEAASAGTRSFGQSTTAAIGGLAAMAGGVMGTVHAFTSFTSAASESLQVSAQTEAVLKSTGDASGLTAQQVGDLATSLSKVIPIDDEVIQSATNVLLTFKNIGGDILPMVTEETANLATAMHEDLSAAALQVGKALNDPVQGMTALGRAGVQFTDSQKQTIASLVETGHAADAQKIVLQELETEFGNSARAAGQTLPGQLAIAQTAFGNLKEQIGIFLLQGIIPITQAMMSLPQPIQLIAVAMLGLVPAITAVVGAVILLNSQLVTADIALLPLTGTIALVVAAVAGLGIGIYELVTHWDDLTARWPALQTALDAVKGAVSSLWNTIKEAGPGIGAIFLGMAQIIIGAFQAILLPIYHVGDALVQIIQGHFGAAKDAAVAAIHDVENAGKRIAAGFQQIGDGISSMGTEAAKVGPLLGPTLAQLHGIGPTAAEVAHQLRVIGPTLGDVADNMRASGHEASLMGHAITAADQAYEQMVIAMNAVQNAQADLADAYQIGISIQSTYTKQAGEYKTAAGNVQSALDIVNQKIADGNELTTSEVYIRDHATEAMGRYNGGVQDATETAGYYATANAEIMKIQDDLIAQNPGLVQGSAEYNDKLAEAAANAGIGQDAIDNFKGSNENLSTAMSGVSGVIDNLIIAVDKLTSALLGIPEQRNILVNMQFIATGDTQLFGQVTAGGHPFGLSGFADGGVVTQPTLAMVGENGPEAIIPLNQLHNVASAKILSGNADAGNVHGTSAWLPFIEKLIKDLAGAAGDLGDMVEQAKTFSDAAKSAVDLVSNALSLLSALGTASVTYGPDIAAKIDALKQMTEQVVTSLEASSVLFKSHGLAYLKTYADAAKSALDVVKQALDLAVAIGQTTVVYDAHMEQAIANLKFIAEKATVSIGESAAVMDGDFLAGIQIYADAAKAALDVIKSAVDVVQTLGSTTVVYDADMERAIANLKFIAEKAAVSIGESAQVQNGPLIDGIKAYADGAGAALKIMKDAIDVVQALGDTSIVYGQWQQDAIANLKFIAEKAAVSIGESAQVENGPLIDGIKRYADGAGAAVGLMSSTLDLVKALSTDTGLTSLTTEQVAEQARYLAGDSRIIADAFVVVAKDWKAEVNPALKDFNDAVSSSTGAAGSVFSLLGSLNDKTKGSTLSAENVRNIANRLAHEAQIIAEAFAYAAKHWNADVNPAMKDFADAVGYALGPAGQVYDLLGKIHDAHTGKDKLDVVKLADIMRHDVLVMLDAITYMAAAAEPAMRHAIVYQQRFSVVFDLVSQLRAYAAAAKPEADAFLHLVTEIADALTRAAQKIDQGMTAVGASVGAASSGGGTSVSVPALAGGGIVTRPTVALIGEAGPEAVIPLSQGGFHPSQQPTTIENHIHVHLPDGSVWDATVEDSLSRILARTT